MQKGDKGSKRETRGAGQLGDKKGQLLGFPSCLDERETRGAGERGTGVREEKRKGVERKQRERERDDKRRGKHNKGQRIELFDPHYL